MVKDSSRITDTNKKDIMNRNVLIPEKTVRMTGAPGPATGFDTWRLSVPVILCVMLYACTKPQLDDDFKPGDPPPIAGGYVNSEEIAPDHLVAYFPFDGNIDDSKGTITGGTVHGAVSFAEGRKGQAYQGTADGFVSYDNPGTIANLSSFTVTCWINTQKHQGGAQSVFMLSREDGNFWGNFFLLIEGNGRSDNKMQLKLHFEKPSVPNAEHWIDPGDKYWPDDMYGAWRHVAFTYDENTSEAARYISGNKSDLPDDPSPGGDGDIVHRKASGDAASGTPLGPLAFKDATRFLIGAYQNQLGAPYNAPESWMLTYTGKLDELRIYDKALSPQEIAALYKLERQSR